MPGQICPVVGSGSIFSHLPGPKLCAVDYVDVCAFPDFRLEPVWLCAETGKHVQVQKPVATNLETAREMIDVAHPNAGRGRLTTTFVFVDDRARVLPCARKASYDPSVV